MNIKEMFRNYITSQIIPYLLVEVRMDMLGFPQCVHLSDSGECPKNIKTIWDSHCTIGNLLAMLDMTDCGSEWEYCGHWSM